MNMNEISAAIQSLFPNGVMCRRGGQNFLAIPAEVVDGIQTYVRVSVGGLLSKATKTVPAFNLEEAVEEYAEYTKRAAERASTPKKSNAPDPEKAAARAARREKLLAWFKENPGEHTSQEIFNTLTDVYAGAMIMAVGSDAKELLNEGKLTVRREKQKNYYSYKAEE